MRHVSLPHIVEEMETIWGNPNKPAHKTSFRRRLITKKLKSALYRSVVANGKPDPISFVFTVAKDSNIKVCESAYLNIIGHPNSSLEENQRNY